MHFIDETNMPSLSHAYIPSRSLTRRKNRDMFSGLIHLNVFIFFVLHTVSNHVGTAVDCFAQSDLQIFINN